MKDNEGEFWYYALEELYRVWRNYNPHEGSYNNYLHIRDIKAEIVRREAE